MLPDRAKALKTTDGERLPRSRHGRTAACMLEIRAGRVSNADARAYVRAVALSIACEIHPLNNLRVLRYLVHTLGLTEEAKNGWYRHWVEQGLAPERVLATQSASGKVVRTRPLCPYPQVAKYRGTGSVDDAASFACAEPTGAKGR